MMLLLLGEMNFECRVNHPGFVKCNNVFGSHSIHYCDEFVIGDDRYTNTNISLGYSSFIDHIFVSDELKQYSSSLEI